MERLRIVFQPGSQVQVQDELADGQALPSDALGALMVFRGQRFFCGKRLRIACDQGEGRADIVGDAGDPLCAGVVPLPQLFRLALKYAGGLVQLPGKLLCDPFFRQQDRAVLGEGVHTPGKRAKGAVEPVAEPERKPEDKEMRCLPSMSTSGSRGAFPADEYGARTGGK